MNSDILYRPSIFIFSPINTRIKPQIEDGLSLRQRIIGLVSNLILIKMEPILSLKFLATVGSRHELAYSDSMLFFHNNIIYGPNHVLHGILYP